MTPANPYAAPTAEVRDIVADDQPQYAERGSRLFAVIVDSLLSFVAMFLPLTLSVGIDQLATGGMFAILGLPAGPLMITCGMTLALIGVTWYLVYKNGQTIGKKLLGIKVVRADGSRATVARIFWVRNVPFWLVSLIPLAGPLVSFIDALFIFRGARQCLHDQLADTIVIKA